MKFKKLFLLVAITFCSVILLGCKDKDNSKNDNITTTNIEVNAKYLRMKGYQNDSLEGDYIIAKSVTEMEEFIDNYENYILFKYNEEYFNTKSLLIFKLFETSYNTENEIKTCETSKNTLTIKVSTTKYGEPTSLTTINVCLELTNEEIENIDNVKIFKNEVEIAKKKIGYELIDTKKYFVFTEFPSNLSTERTIINSKEELKSTLDLYKPSWTDESLLEKYDEEYFNHKVIIFFMKELGGTNIIRTVKRIVLSDDKLAIYISQEAPDGRNDDLTYHYYLLFELDKDISIDEIELRIWGTITR